MRKEAMPITIYGIKNCDTMKKARAWLGKLTFWRLTEPALPKRRLDKEGRRKLLEELRVSGAAKAKPGPCAARSQDFLYGDDGLPR